MIDKEEAIRQAEDGFARLKDSYKRAIEAALGRVPVRNGVVSVRDLWLETSLPLDLITEILKENGIEFPPQVKRVDLGDRAPLRKRKGARNGRRK
jgi:hypothetical protein